MRRSAILALLAVALLPLATAASTAAAAATQVPDSTGAGLSSESDNPISDQGSNYNYRSNVTSVKPDVTGLSVQVLEFADRLLLTNHTGRTVTIYGYQGEPYARVLANGTAELNVRSPATYLNTSFYGNVTVPPSASPSAAPKWEVVDRTGQFEWHDHRIHWMSPLTPPEVKDKSRLTLIFDWQVPIEVGTSKGAISGQLYWMPESSKASIGVILLGVAIAVAGGLFVLFVRRRRARTPGGTVGGVSASGPSDPPQEAW